MVKLHKTATPRARELSINRSVPHGDRHPRLPMTSQTHHPHSRLQSHTPSLRRQLRAHLPSASMPCAEAYNRGHTPEASVRRSARNTSSMTSAPVEVRVASYWSLISHYDVAFPCQPLLFDSLLHRLLNHQVLAIGIVFIAHAGSSSSATITPSTTSASE